ncbi:MAG: superoxide dismutase [Longimonas sp.]|uniref:superoxide dismutase n=1 Tax=Longimonas sp. TaxID=2039626 RepID=UPI0039765622
MAFSLPDLPYDYDALEPVIDEQTMRIHHGKHHQGYTNKLNAALEGHDDLSDHSIEALLHGLDNLPADIQTAVRNNGGGFANHRLFWSVLSPEGGGEPTGALAEAIDEEFGSFDAFKKSFTNAATGQFGSGWGWLVTHPDGSLDVYSTPNQDSPYLEGDTPILGVDVWEHAYYLNYQNERGTYVEKFWDIVDWDAVNERYEGAAEESA